MTAPSVDDEGKSQVGGSDDGHTDVDSFVVVARLTHLRDDGEKGRCASAGAENGRNAGDASDKGRVADDVVSQFKVSRLRSGGRTITSSDTDTVDPS